LPNWGGARKSSEAIFDAAGKQRKVDELKSKASAPGFWDDAAAAQQSMQELARLEATLEPFHRVRGRVEDLQVLAELAQAEEDGASYEAEIARDLAEAREWLGELEMANLLSGEHDGANAILEINAGAGGTEACDWVTMLLRMYLRWAERRGLKAEVLDQTPGEVAGLKSVTVDFEGLNAYGYLKAERGVHRLVRISPFDAQKRRHTSFASVDVIPEMAEANGVEINPKDLRIDTYLSGGAGGQNVQKNETAVRITHLPTGIVVQCQNERSQLKNREFAMKVLQSRLLEIKRREREEEIAKLRGEQRAIEWGNQIRSYVFQPYTLVKDHRTNTETGNIIAVMDGEIDPFIHAFLSQFRGE
jgi:peptide chain release factor 2